MYGHPTIFAKPALDAVIRAKKEGYLTNILPGISSESCLFADLLIDPGSKGCISLEATDLLIYQKKLDPSFHVLIWQISVIGALRHAKHHDNTKGIIILSQYLNKYYDLNHPMILYTAAQYPGLDPQIREIKLKDLSQSQPSRTSTLYIPPTHQPCCDKAMLTALNMNFIDSTKQ